ncbi:FAD-dependent oxidoreductase, partial [candidate division KSB1 bacterium]|nr:FAD-dependent oxidoreductase [candidate division KSB1 bacterium]
METLKVPAASLSNISIEKESLDARRKNQPVYIYNFIADTNDASILNLKNVTAISEKHTSASIREIIELDEQPVIVGTGPSGLFAALDLLKKGYRPVIIERGKPVSERLSDVR